MATPTVRPRRSTSGSKKPRRSKTLTGSQPKRVPKEVVTVGDDVQITNDLQGVVRFVGEIVQRSGVYYGIELKTERGKNNGTLRTICYFKCRPKCGVFVRRTRIQRVLHSKRNSHKGTIHRIGINQRIQINMGSYKVVGNVRFIGTPTKANGIYYGVELTKPVSDTNGIYNSTRYFTTDHNCAHFIKANSKRITYPVNASTPKLALKGGSHSLKISSELLRKHAKPDKKRRRFSLNSSDTDTDENASSDSDDDDTDSDESSESKDDELSFMEYHKYYKNREKQLYNNAAIQRHSSSDTTRKTPLKIIGNEWMISAQNADTFKKRYDCTRVLMEKVCDKKGKLPMNLNFGGDAINLLRLFADWLQMETHVVVRKHILQLLVPIGNTSYPVSVWKGSGMQIAEALITTEYFEKKRGFIHLVSPALIAVYIGSYSQLKDWELWLIKVVSSASRSHVNAQNECWDFLCQLLEIAVMCDSLLWILEDLMHLMQDGSFMDIVRKAVNKTKDRRVRLQCCLFAYGIAHSFVENLEIQQRYTMLIETEDLRLYFDAIEKSKYKQLFKPLKSANEPSPKPVIKPRKSYPAKAKMHKLEPSVSAPVNVEHEESMLLEHSKPRRKRSKSRRSASIGSSSRTSNDEMDDLAVIQMDVEFDVDSDLNKKKLEDVDDILSDDLQSDIIDDAIDLHDDDIREIHEDKEAQNEEEDDKKEDIKEPLLHELCPTCIKRKANMETLTLQLNGLHEEMNTLHKLVSGIKSDGNDIERGKKLWITKLEEARNRYKESDTNMKAMEQLVYELRQKVYALKKLDQERLDILEPKHLQKWSSRHILTWIISLDHGTYLKFENNLHRLLLDRNINGASLIHNELNESDLRSCGIHKFRERKALMKHMTDLLERYNERNGNIENEKKEQDDDLLMVDVSVMSGSMLSEQKEPGNVSVMSGSVLSEQMEGCIKEEEEEEKQVVEEEPGGNIVKKEEKKVIEKEVEEAKENKQEVKNKDKNEIQKKKKKGNESEEDGLECNQCYVTKKVDQGYDDENGIWYCLMCWDEFNAVQQRKEKKKKESEKKKRKKKRKSEINLNLEDIDQVNMKKKGSEDEKDDKVQKKEIVDDRTLHQIKEESNENNKLDLSDSQLNLDPGSPVIHMQMSNKSDSINRPRRMSL